MKPEPEMNYRSSTVKSTVSSTVRSTYPCPHLKPVTREATKLLLELGCPDDEANRLVKQGVEPLLRKVQKKLKKWHRKALYFLSQTFG